jgi:putative serine protease XkdF
MTRKIKGAVCKSIALCKRGKNGLTTLFKSSLAEAAPETMSRGDMEKGELLTVVALPDWIDEDGDEFDSASVLEEMAHTFIAEGANVDIEHDGKPLSREQVRPVESFIIQPSDARFKNWPTYDGKSVDASGGWAVKFKIDDPQLRAAYRAGEWDGVSLFGPAAVEQLALKAASQRVAARMGRRDNQEHEMTLDEMKALLAAERTQIVELVKSTVAGLMAKPEAPKQEPKEEPKAEAPKAPVFAGDASKAEDLEAHAKALRTFELNEKLRLGKITADELVTMAKSMSEGQPSVEELNEAGIEADESDSPEVRKLQVQLFKARKSSRAPERKGAEQTEEVLAKASADEAKAIAALGNTMLGSAPAGSGMRVVKA